jgi:hypothetical protein
MKRLFPTSLALLLVMASFGNVLAAAFCPRVLGRGCCFAKTASHTHSQSAEHENIATHHMHMDGMSMDGMTMDSMNTGDRTVDAASMDHMAMNDRTVDGPITEVAVLFSPAAVSEGPFANNVSEPVESCTHCLGHSGTLNSPVSFVCVSDRSGKETRSVLLPVSRFLPRPTLASAQIGLPRVHAPPGSNAPRHILINVFLI